MRQLEKNDKSSKSLLANVLDLEDDFLICSGGVNMSKPGKNEYFETLPTLIPHSTTYPDASSEINISSASVDSSYSRKHSQNFTNFLGMLQYPRIESLCSYYSNIVAILLNYNHSEFA